MDFTSVIDELWGAFEEFGIEDGYDIVGQATLLLVLRRLDIIQTAAERKALVTAQPPETSMFGTENDAIRWSKLKNVEPAAMFVLFETKVIHFIRGLGGAFADAVFMIPSPSALHRLVDLVDKIPYADPALNGAVYEYLVSRITTKNSSGGFPTPRHLIDLMVEITDPRPTDVFADPAVGSGGFPVRVAQLLRERYPDLLLSDVARQHFHRGMFHGVDSDPAFARMATTNVLLHGVEGADIQRRDSLAPWSDGIGGYSLVLTNPPFSGSIEKSALDRDLYRHVKSTTKAPLFVGRVLSLLQLGGRAAVIVPEGVLFGSTKAQVALRRSLVEDHKLDAVIRVPPAAYQPFSTTQTAILLFTKTSVGGTERVWFYDIRADGRSLDKRRTPVTENDLPDVVRRWKTLGDPASPELTRARTEQSFLVLRDEIAAHNYELSLNRYQEIVEDQTPTRAPAEIVADIDALNEEILAGMVELKELLG
ncbi:N-6 DNA methylase [Microbacterium pumilum]|uniref:site-specific DNA-methyltransferase (adenine-specific) n=1 Tax=Microbacterium pumilum TaxID=344165 RepID=A0ABP5DR62_9MICO